ncbi:hypothetical protein HYW72_01590 [Candidatus Nomurabacteria bacterium]|nr:hypothetical protein [Candidatus Nomurabacteria bacterium]
MEYAKTIKYGDNLEIYEYEHRPAPKIKKVKEKSSYYVKPSVDEIFTKREDNILQSKTNFRRLVSANLSNNIPLFISLTHGTDMKDIVIGWKNYRKFIQRMRYKFGENFKYIAVPEFQPKSGRVHFHVLFWRLPLGINAKDERKNRVIAKIWGHGFADVKDTDGHEKLAGYLAKYMAKAFTDKRLKNQKAYASSKNAKRPIVTRDAIVLKELMENVGENDLPVFDKPYEVKWLGKCRHRLFKITNHNNMTL